MHNPSQAEIETKTHPHPSLTNTVPPRDHLRNRFIGLLAVLGFLLFLKYAASVVMPLAFGLFLAAVMLPLYKALHRRMGDGFALILTLIAFLAVFAAFVAGLVYCGNRVIDRWPTYDARFGEIVQSWEQRAEAMGLRSPQAGNGTDGIAANAASKLAPKLVGAAKSFGLGILVVAIMALTLLELSAFRRKLDAIGGSANRVLEATYEIAALFQRYFFARTLVSIIQGVTTGLFALMVGLDLALIWGVSSFLLNFIPTIGSILAVFPPAIFAIVQFTNPMAALGIVVGIAVIQLVLGNYVDPRLEGRYLRLSPLVVLLSIVLWGWIWGIPGALIGVPMTLAISVICAKYTRARWVATLLGHG